MNDRKNLTASVTAGASLLTLASGAVTLPIVVNQNGNLAEIAYAGVRASLVADHMVIETSEGRISNDPALLINTVSENRAIYQSEALILTVTWTGTENYAERVWTLKNRQEKPFHVVRVDEVLKFKRPFERIDLHTDGGVYQTPINLFLRDKCGSIGFGVTYPWVDLGMVAQDEVKLGYEIEMTMEKGQTFTSETTFLVPCTYTGHIIDKTLPMPRVANPDSEPMDHGELRAMRRYVEHRVPESKLPVDGFFLWLNCWWADLVKAGDAASLIKYVPGTGIEDVMTQEVWWGHDRHPRAGKALIDLQPGEKLAMPEKMTAIHTELMAKGIFLSSFCSPANPYFSASMPNWLSIRQDGSPNKYISNHTYSCFGNRSYVEAFAQLQSQMLTDSQGRFWAWDGRTISFGEWDQGDAGDRYQKLPCYAKDHGHLPGKQFFQEYRNLRWMIEELRQRHPRLCMQTYWGLKRGMPWMAAGLNAVEGYYEAESPSDQRLQVWYNQQYRFLPVYFNWSHLESQSLKGFEENLISAISMSTHCQLGKCWPALMKEDRERNIATIKKWLDFSVKYRPFLSVGEHLFGTPGGQWADGTAHCIKDKGVLFLFHGREMSDFPRNAKNLVRPEQGLVAIPLETSIGLTEGTHYKVTQVYPHEGKLIGILQRGSQLLLPVDNEVEVYTLEATREALIPQTDLPASPVITPAFVKGSILEAAGRVVKSSPILNKEPKQGEPELTEQIPTSIQ